MTVTLAGTATPATGSHVAGSNTTVTVTLAGVAAGRMALLWVVVRQPQGGDVSFLRPSGWREWTSRQADNATAGLTGRLFARVLDGTEATVAVEVYGSVAAVVVAGSDTFSALLDRGDWVAASASTSGASGHPANGSGTPSAPGLSYLLAAAQITSAANFTAPAGWTETWSANGPGNTVHATAAWKATTAVAQTPAAWGASQSLPWIAAHLLPSEPGDVADRAEVGTTQLSAAVVDEWGDEPVLDTQALPAPLTVEPPTGTQPNLPTPTWRDDPPGQYRPGAP